MIKNLTAAVVLMSTLGGCINAEKVFEPSVIDHRQCVVAGTTPIEPAYVTCLAQLDAARNGRSCFGSCH